jgi:hypothetical protein
VSGEAGVVFSFSLNVPSLSGAILVPCRMKFNVFLLTNVSFDTFHISSVKVFAARWPVSGPRARGRPRDRHGFFALQ